MQGNYEAVVTSIVALTFSADVSGGTFDLPGLGVYGAAMGDLVPGYGDGTKKVSDFITGTTTITNTSATAGFIPGYGFVVHPPGTETLTTHTITLTTKDEYKNLYTFNVEKFDGIKVVITAGSFELLPWAEVFPEFTHMGHDVPLSNHHDLAKPVNATAWVKFILTTNHRNAGYHGASETGGYLERFVLYVTADDWTTATPPVSAKINALKALFDTWAS